MHMEVILPTFRRPDQLRHCLKGLAAQTRPAGRITIVVQHADDETNAAIPEISARYANLRVLYIDRPGKVAALNLALESLQGDIISFTDDDVVPRPDWLERIEKWFARDPAIGGVGGRFTNWADGQPDEREEEGFGRLHWYGRLVVRLDHAAGDARDVDFIAGNNMSFRQAVIHNHRFDERLIGPGAEPGEDIKFSLAVKQAGWRVVCDPAVHVDHYPGPTPGNYSRDDFAPGGGLYDTVHNLTVATLDHFSPLQRLVFVPWALLVGMKSWPGLLQWVRLLLLREDHATAKLAVTLPGRIAGIMTWCGPGQAPAPSVFRGSRKKAGRVESRVDPVTTDQDDLTTRP